MDLLRLGRDISEILGTAVIRVRNCEEITEFWFSLPIEKVSLATKEEIKKLGKPDNFNILIGEILLDSNEGTKFLLVSVYRNI